MSRRVLRKLSDTLLGRLVDLAPIRLRDWARAVRAEAAAIADDRDAIGFAAAAGSGLALTFVWARLRDVAGFAPDRPAPRVAAAIAATVAVMIGVGHLFVMGAPRSMIGVNIAALAVGLMLLAGTRIRIRQSRQGHAIAAITAAALLVLTNLFGVASHGVVRWVAAGPLMVQSSLVLLPGLMVMFARQPTAAGTAALIVAAGAIAMQPDRAMAGAMFAGTAMLWFFHRKRHAAMALAASCAGFVITLARADSVPPARFAEGVLTSSWAVYPLLGIAVAAGAAVLLLPAAAGWTNRGVGTRQCAVFGAVWLAIIVAALVGNYPVPLVGYGGSAIVGYLLSACMLPPGHPADHKLPVPARPARPRPGNLARRHYHNDRERRSAFPLPLIERGNEKSPALYLSNGRHDGFGNFEDTQALARRAQERGVSTEWRRIASALRRAPCL